MQKTIAVIRGDGIGPEIIGGALLVLDAVAAKFGHRFAYNDVLAGGAAIDATGAPFSDAALAACKAADAVLLGAVGGPKWDDLPAEKRPEKALFGLRAGLGLYTNLRPAVLMRALASASPLRGDIVEKGIDFLVVRELTGGIYFGARKTETVDGEAVATDTMVYSEGEIERIVVAGFEAAMGRRKKLCSVDKANVLDTSRLWRKVAHRVAQNYPQVAYSDMLVDNAAMQLVRAPWQFDVIVTENMFGDILSDEASMLTGSIGLLPSASLGAPGAPGLFEPIHGSAPDIAGTDRANPIGTILSAAMLLRHGLGMIAEAGAVEAAVDAALASGLRTADTATAGQPVTGCKKTAEIISGNIGK